ITNLPAITTTLRMKSYGVIKVMEAEKLIEVIKEKLYVILNNKLIIDHSSLITHHLSLIVYNSYYRIGINF
ncbi:TPA: hypothetical protein ACG0AO_003453, partial [Elizabethkingia meningoseptica]